MVQRFAEIIQIEIALHHQDILQGPVCHHIRHKANRENRWFWAEQFVCLPLGYFTKLRDGGKCNANASALSCARG
jgi:hypothetical protein